MATPRSTMQQRPPVDDIPDVFDDTTVADVPPEIAADGHDSTASFEELMAIGFDDARDDQDILASRPPVGDWTKEDSWELSVQVNSQDHLDGDMQEAGRTILVLHGKPLPRVANDQEYQPTLFFRISPDKRKKFDDPTKDDMAYRLYLRAKELYVSLYSEKPTVLGQLVTMLREDSYLVRTMNGDNGPLVVDVKARRPLR